LSARREREHRRQGREPVCSLCRRPPIELTDAERERYVRWWVEKSGLSIEELREIATAIGAQNDAGSRASRCHRCTRFRDHTETTPAAHLATFTT
jgi:hypothetical protein